MEKDYFFKKLYEMVMFVCNNKTEDTVQEHIKNMTENSLIYKYSLNILIHLTLDKKNKKLYRKKFGVPLKFDTDIEIESIMSKIGAEYWEDIISEVYDVFNHYHVKIKNYKKLNRLINKQRKLATELSSLMRKQNLDLYSDDFNTPFDGLIAKHVINKSIVSAIEAMPTKYSSEEMNNIMFDIVGNTIYASGYSILPNILDDFANILKSGFIGEKTKAYLDDITTGKLSFKEYAKKSIFKIIKQHWPSQRNPNKEVALIANLLLSLDGKNKITPNDISQMNKKDRKKYNENPYFNF